MKQKIRGLAFVLGDNIDTDQIIPAEHLVYDPTIEEERRMFGKLALSGVPEAQAGLPKGGIPFVEEGANGSKYTVIVAGKNFGCGSSREHAPLSLAESGIEAVVAVSYARIFFRNSVNGGYLVPIESEDNLVDSISTGDDVEIDLEKNTVTVVGSDKVFGLKPVGEILPILEAGDIFEYARSSGMMDA